ncbi:hypothetical protein RFE80_003705 [Klebsiella pneumoniae]|nr:AP2 domain-containing protein [Klebsiella pneumoniae]
MDSVHHIWCPLSSQEYQDLPDGAETTLTNMMNRSVGKNSKSGVKGIGWDKKSQKWRARCQTDGKRKDVGFFDSIEEAKTYLALYRGHAHGAFANDGGDTA